MRLLNTIAGWVAFVAAIVVVGLLFTAAIQLQIDGAVEAAQQGESAVSARRQGGQEGMIGLRDIVDNIRPVDGDTIRADIYLGRDVVLEDQSIRLQGYDAWEATRRRRNVKVTDEEIVKGKAATEALRRLIGQAEVAYLTDGGRDRYGRCLGYLTLVLPDGETVAVDEWMRGHGHDRQNGLKDQ